LPSAARTLASISSSSGAPGVMTTEEVDLGASAAALAK
jgi:hypothetical protein